MTDRSCRGGSEAEAGFTLVELLIVLAIVAVAAGAVVLGVGAAGGEPSAQAEARRLAERLQLAADDVMIDDRELAFAWDADGYGFVERTAGGWRESSGGGWHRLPGSMHLTAAGAERGRRPLANGGAGQPFAAELRSSTGGSWRIIYDGLTVAVESLPA